MLDSHREVMCSHRGGGGVSTGRYVSRLGGRGMGRGILDARTYIHAGIG